MRQGLAPRPCHAPSAHRSVRIRWSPRTTHHFNKLNSATHVHPMVLPFSVVAATYHSKKYSMTQIAVIALKTKPDIAPNNTAGHTLRFSGTLKTAQ